MIKDLVLLSGGLATRLQPISHSIPKAMIDVNGRPFVAYQLELLKKQGIENVVICLGYLGEQVKAFVGNGEKFDINVRYSYDGDKLLGTGGAIKKAVSMLPEKFFVMYGDSYLPIDFRTVADSFENDNKLALMTIIKNNNKWDKSNVIFANNKIVKYDKNNIVPEMEFIDYGLGVISKDIFTVFNEDEVFDLAMIYKDLADNDDLAGYEVQNRFYEIGSFVGIEEFKKYIN